MNKTAIRNFAVQARRKLIEEISHKAYGIGITKDRILEVETFEGGFRVKGRENGQTFKKYELEQRDKLIQNIRHKGFEQVIEEVAYTWFNRFIALRFMEVNNYLSTGVRVLSSVEEGKVEPDIVKEALNMDLDIDPEIIYRLQDANDTEDLYKYLLVKQCNQLGKIMPSVFEEIADYTELLLPDKLLVDGSVIRDLVEEIEEYDWKIELNEEEEKEEVEKGEHGIEIIGWLYQYYISEKKDEVFAGLKKNKKITKENIPAATQLFTPKWIVKYMIENSLGRLWLESHPNVELKGQWKYYLEEAEQEPEVQKQLEELKNPNLNPEDIKVLDPAMGSGHILVYAFDLLYEIYLSAGYSEREIPSLILEKNLYGLDIDDRAGQLASFALLMKARSKNRRIFRNKLQMNLRSIQESNDIPKEAIEYLVSPKETEIEKHFHKEDVEYLIEVFHDAKEYGSILEVKEIDFKALENRIEEIRNNAPEDIFELQYKEVILEKIPPLIEQAKIMSQKYDVVSTNPPYMGNRGMNSDLSKYISDKYPDSKSDLFAVFMELDKNLLKTRGYMAMINQHQWMFASSFERLRKKLINNRTIVTMLHLGPRTFPEISGEVVQSTSFIYRKNKINEYTGTFLRLIDYKTAELKEEKMLYAINNHDINYRYLFKTKNLMRVPGLPIAYWVSKNVQNTFTNSNIEKYGYIGKGLDTCNQDKFERYWIEVDINNISLKTTIENKESIKTKWFPFSKGGGFRKWYGNYWNIVNWENDGREVRNYRNADGSLRSRPQNVDKYFLKAVTWSSISSSNLGARILTNAIFGNGSALFLNKEFAEYRLCFMGLLNSKVAMEYLSFFSPALSFNAGDLMKIPIIFPSKCDTNKTIQFVRNNINIARLDWDSFETSWDFKVHPLANFNKYMDNYYDSLLELGTLVDREPIYVANLEHAYEQYKEFTEVQFNQLKANEEELNRIFIDIYGLQDEVTPEVEDKDITISKANRERDIKSFISYAVGCMFGRYSLDEEGLIYAGGDFNDKFRRFNENWEIKTKDGWKQSSIKIAEHNVVPIADGDYFEDDILERFVEFVKVSFGRDTLEENLEYIAETLGKRANETSRQAIRRYFLRDFYKDHVRIYKKRPIYWLFDSGRQNGFKALIYMHRYNPYSLARVRTDYLHSLQKKYEGEINHLDILIDSEISNREKAAARKNKETIFKQIQECRLYDEALAHVANQRIEIDLDDGVKVNYDKFQGIKIPQGEGRKPLKADLLGKI